MPISGPFAEREPATFDLRRALTRLFGPDATPEQPLTLGKLAALASTINQRLEERAMLGGSLFNVQLPISGLAPPLCPFDQLRSNLTGRDVTGAPIRPTTMVVTVDALAPCYYSLGGEPITIGNNGLSIPTPGGILRIRGFFNISTFCIVATSAAVNSLINVQLFARAPYDEQ